MGGGVIRTAAKAAFVGGYRSAAEVAAARRAVRPSSTAAPPVGESAMFSASVHSDETATADPSLTSGAQNFPCFDDWEFAGGKEEELFDAIQPAPRIVFGPVPTLEEAKEAASHLKDAINEVYHAGASEESLNSSLAAATCVSSAILPEGTNHVAHAFSLLQGSSAQNVVASLASDKNVWDAIMKNEKVKELFMSQDLVSPPETDVALEESVLENLNAEESAGNNETHNISVSVATVSLDWDHVKRKVSKVFGNISSLVQDIMGTSVGPTNTKAVTCTGTSDAGCYMDYGVGASFLALAVLTILVVLVKRGA